MVGLVAGLVLVYTPPVDRVFVWWVLLIALGLKIIMASLYQSYLFTGGLPLYAPDGDTYSKFGWYISRILLGEDPTVLPSVERVYWNYDSQVQEELQGALPSLYKYQTGPYTFFLGYLYAAFGYVPLLARLINIMLSVASAFLIMRVTHDLAGRWGARAAFTLVLFWPSLFFFSLSLLKDSAIVFGVVLVVWSVHRILRGAPLALAGVVGGIGLVGLLRWQAALLLLTILVLWGVWHLPRRLRGVLFLGAVIGIFVLGPSQTGSLLKETLARVIGTHVGYLSSGGVNYSILPPDLINISVGDLSNLSWSELSKIYLRGVVHYLTEPWLSHLHTLKLKVFFPQMIAWYACGALAVLGLLALRRHNRALSMFIFLFLAVFISAYGLSEGNIGTLIRHRDMITPAVLILAVVGARALFDQPMDLFRP